jgi:hypothetical protein
MATRLPASMQTREELTRGRQIPAQTMTPGHDSEAVAFRPVLSHS